MLHLKPHVASPSGRTHLLPSLLSFRALKHSQRTAPSPQPCPSLPLLRVRSLPASAPRPVGLDPAPQPAGFDLLPLPPAPRNQPKSSAPGFHLLAMEQHVNSNFEFNFLTLHSPNATCLVFFLPSNCGAPHFLGRLHNASHAQLVLYPLLEKEAMGH